MCDRCQEVLFIFNLYQTNILRYSILVENNFHSIARKNILKESRKCLNGSELFLGTQVEAKWVDGNSYEAVVIGFPPNTERVRVKFISDGIKYSALVQHVTTCSNKESQGLEAGSSSSSSIVGRMPVADEEMLQHRMQLPEKGFQNMCRVSSDSENEDIQNEKAAHSAEKDANSNMTDSEDELEDSQSYGLLREALKNIVVPVYHKNNGKRNYSKPSYWHYFERKFISNIKKHYVKCHIDKEAVKNMVQAEEGVAKGHRDRLVNLGNYKYTKKVIQAGYVELVVVRMPDTYKHAADYLPCHLCLGFYSRDTLCRHIKDCSCQFDDQPNSHGAVGKGVSLISHVLPASTVDPEVSKLINGMRETLENPGIIQLIEWDNLVLGVRKKPNNAHGAKSRQKSF
ncbi:hypothetical protein EB796_016280 [Bugula neritina]|uniref:Tudor domain-containing protein n=1 Tax=Bugula neritina TaxID=10212 RepID=A0A7J7JGE0_BUGNE|nr:hypothetical protein EB796_016280 [Bugula neritina]